ncbi:gluconate:H+ symporter [Corynebacterium pacaense]|uniref:GntT/GntP/DsdX family permease n=1 Tax=Corynebacterium pacaense TaxID=1816684 RepID=UPI0009B99FBE|nr:gluconate:H+ symporter [Corynebacterium pacaense]
MITHVLAAEMAQQSPGRLVFATVFSIALIVALIVWAKLHPFLSLMIGSAALALTAGTPVVEMFSSFSSGFGSTLGSVGVLVALGAVIGGFLVSSGAADSIVDTFLSRTTTRWRPWVMAGLAFLMGIPLFFEVGIVLLIPVVILVARRSKTPVILLGIPALAGLSALHALVPPHPGPLLAIDALEADLGLTLALGLLVSIPVVIISGPIAARFMVRWVPIEAPLNTPGGSAADTGDGDGQRSRPSVAAGFFVILLPVALMLSRTLVETLEVPEGTIVRTTFDVLGTPLNALLITVLVAMVLLGFMQGRSAQDSSNVVSGAFGPIAGVLLIVGAGGGFKQTLVDTGVAEVVGNWVQAAPLSPLVTAWLVAVFIRLATGSATVATITAAGIMAPVVADAGSVEAALMVLAIGAGSVFLSHVNDAGFWLVKEYFGMTVVQTFKTWSAMETLLSVTGLLGVLALSLVL